MPDNLLNRYLGGEQNAVWTTLRQLGPAIWSEVYFDDALAVCHEMVLRSKANIQTIIRRLQAIGYEFWSDRSHSLFLLTADEARHPWSQDAVWMRPCPYLPDEMVGLNPKAPGILPLIIQVWAREIGTVQLLGSHPVVSPLYQSETHQPIYSDPFMVTLLFDPNAQPLPHYEDASKSLIISMTDVDKSRCPIERRELYSSYDLECPTTNIDAVLKGNWHEGTFVDYVCKAFEWGGFPGWERYSQMPSKELEYLRSNLLPI